MSGKVREGSGQHGKEIGREGIGKSREREGREGNGKIVREIGMLIGKDKNRERT